MHSLCTLFFPKNQVYAEKFDLMTPFQAEDDDGLGEVDGMSALHIAVQQTRSIGINSSPTKIDSHAAINGSHNNLALVEFIIQNSPSVSVQRTNNLGETALHHSVRHGCMDALRLLLQAGGLPTPMLIMTNKAGQTALKLAEDLAANSTVDKEVYKGCAELLRLAESILSVKSGVETSGSVCSLFPNSEANERVLAARSALMEAVDQLHSVDWGLIDQPSSKSRFAGACRRTASVAASDLGVTFALGGLGRSHDSSTESPKFSPYSKQHTVTGDGDGPVSVVDKSGRCLGRLQNYVSQYGHALATLPRKKGPAPRPPPTESSGGGGGPLEFEVHYDNSPRARHRTRFAKFGNASASTISNTKSPEERPFGRKMPSHSLSATDSPASVSQNPLRRTTASVVESELSTSETPPELSRLAELMHMSLCGEVDRDFSFDSSGSKHASPAHSNRSVTKKPSSGTNSSPSKSSGGDSNGSNAPPPVPPKPQVSSSLLYSTLPSRTSARKDFRLSTQRDPDNIDSESKHALRSALPTTPRLPKPSIFPDVSRSRLGDLLEAIYDCEAERSDELTFRQGELIQLAARPDDDWSTRLLHIFDALVQVTVA
ncbi:unnamed protein product [Echinostoma caproni]|uniref:ANK_REP_REGION domain-containing protein n=1 Tax=Echinostoma caproni TaxID=27848 RepID=A0A183AQ06_9TREM|nr:unnamed protein product [Echinostoma caproni]